MIAEDLGQPADHVRLWVMVNRQNKTTRPDQPLLRMQATVEEEHARNSTQASGFRLWAEVADHVEDGMPLWRESQLQKNNASNNTLLFLKHFDLETQTLKGVGHIYFSRNERVSAMALPILHRMDWPLDTALELYEVGLLSCLLWVAAKSVHQEIKPSMIEPMKPTQTLVQAEIQDGDVICFQKTFSEEE